MPTVNFYLQRKKSKKNDAEYNYITMYFFYGKRFVYPTGEKINPKYWNKNKQEIKKSKYVNNYEVINTYLDDLKKTILEIYKDLRRKKSIINNEVLKQKLDKQLGRQFDKIKAEKNTFIEHFNDKVDKEIQKAKNKSTKANYITLKRYVNDFCKYYKIGINTIEQHQFEKLELFIILNCKPKSFSNKKIANSTLNSYMSTLKSLIINTNKKLNSNNEIKYKLRKTYTTKIFFSEDELKLLYSINITDEQLIHDKSYLKQNRLSLTREKFEVVRDIFVANSFVGLRFSDMINLEKSNFLLHTSDKHETGYDLRQSRIVIYNQKNNKDVSIPIKPIVFKIFQKYNFKLPKRCSSTVIRYIQYIAKVAGFNEKVKKITFQDNERIVYEVLKYELIGTHTARRSFATNAYLCRDIPIKAIMMITGHSKVETFMNYICVSDRDLAKIAAKSKFFQ